MLLPISLLTHFLLEKEPWFASCMTFMPTPAIPIPAITIPSICTQAGKSKVKIKTTGTINRENITIAFMYNFQFPVRFKLFSLK